MKKFLTLAIIVLVALIALSTSVFAAEASTESELSTALVGTDTTITLTGDITLNAPLEIERDVTLDLNGYTMIPSTDFSGGDYMLGIHRQAHLTIKDSGTNGKITNNGMELVVVKLTVYGENDATYAAEFTLESGTLENTYEGESGYATISGNGNRHNTVIEINGGTVTATKKHAIYNPQDGEIIVNGGLVTGATGIEMRSGYLLVNGGTIIGTSKPITTEANGSGATTAGAGIAVAQHTTERTIDVIIEGGTIKGYSALYESNPQSTTAVDLVTIAISGGEFEAINDGTLAVYSANKTDFITGGTFSSDVSDYVDSTSGLEAIEDEDGTVYVGVPHSVTVEDTDNGKITVDKTEAVKGQKVTLKVEPNEGYKLKTLDVITAADSEVTVTDKSFIMPDLGVIVIAEFEEIEVEVKVEDSKDEEPKMGVDISTISVLSIVAVIALAGYVVSKKK